jgi:hypothetical protein
MQRAVRRDLTQKQFPSSIVAGALLKVSLQRVAGFVGQRQGESVSGFPLRNAEFALAPFDVIQGQCHHFAAAQSVSGHQIEHRIISEATKTAAINGAQQSPDLGPRQSFGQLFQSVNPWRLDRFIKVVSEDALRVKVSEKSTDAADNVLHGPATAMGGLIAHESFHLPDVEPAQRACGSFVAQKL